MDTKLMGLTIVEIKYDSGTNVLIDTSNRLITIKAMSDVDLQFIANLTERLKRHEELNFMDVVEYKIKLK